MKKTLITVDNLDGHICSADGRLYAGKDTILTAGAKDELSRRHVEVVYGEAPASCTAGAAADEAAAGNPPAPCCAAATASRINGIEGLVGTVSSMLRGKYGISDPKLLASLTAEALLIMRRNA